MSALADALTNTANDLIPLQVQLQSQGDQQSQYDAVRVNRAIAALLMDAGYVNAQNTEAMLSAEAQVSKRLSALTQQMEAAASKLAADQANVVKIVNIATDVGNIIAGASNPLSIVPTIVDLLKTLNIADPGV